MAKRIPTPADFSVSELKAMLAAKSRIDELESQRKSLQTQLTKVEKELSALLAGAVPRASSRKKAGRNRAAGKTAAKAATAVPRRGRPKKAAGAKGITKKTTQAKTAPRGARSGPTIESVVVDLIKANGGKMAFQEILASIQKKKLVKSKAKSFDNVLRRTISTSQKISRVARGVYKAG